MENKNSRTRQSGNTLSVERYVIRSDKWPYTPFDLITGDAVKWVEKENRKDHCVSKKQIYKEVVWKK